MAIPPKAGLAEEEEEDEDIDALIEDLESQDAAIDYEDEEGAPAAGAARVIPEELLQTDARTGLSSSEVTSRRKKFGLNQMKGRISCPVRTAELLLTPAQRRRKTWQ